MQNHDTEVWNPKYQALVTNNALDCLNTSKMWGHAATAQRRYVNATLERLFKMPHINREPRLRLTIGGAHPREEALILRHTVRDAVLQRALDTSLRRGLLPMITPTEWRHSAYFHFDDFP